MGSPNRGELIEAWLRYQESEHDHPEDDWWAVQEVIELVLSDPDEAWNLIADLVRESDTEWQIVMVGCGALEDLLRLNPDRYMAALEEAAPKNQKLVLAAGYVWLDNEPVRPRVDALLRQYGRDRM